jgi:RsiW-degrading membrane proteinase PrsW (M82 family)
MAWYVANQGSNGNTSNLDGPLDIFISFACYGVPMFIAVSVFWATRQQKPPSVWAVFALTFLGALITLLGVGAAITLMWIPRISAALN